MKTKLPKTLKLTWHTSYKKDYPKKDTIYAVVIQDKLKNESTDFGEFVMETLPAGNGFKESNWDRWDLLGNRFINDVFVKPTSDSSGLRVIAWAEIKRD